MTSMLASSSETDSDRILSVRFEDTCVLIPPSGPAKSPLRPRIITKSYSLPLWKTSSSKRNANPQSPVSPVASQAPNTEAERKAFSLTVSVPRPRRSSIPPSSPCLSKRHGSLPQSPGSSTPSSTVSFPTVTAPIPPSPTLHHVPSFPRIQPASLKQADTVPLRPCCEACHSCVDAALAQGEGWSARWSRGAVRRYSEGEHVHLHAPHPPVFGVTRVWTPKTEGADADGDMPLQDALTIDEVDVKRRSGDYSQAILNNHHVPPPATDDAESDDEDVSEKTTAAPLIPLYHAAILKEEDEDLLFPLPSPRRTPNHSPNLTPTGSQVNLTTPPSGSEANPGPFGNQTNLSTPVVSSPLVCQDNKVSAAPVARTPISSRPPPPIPITPIDSAPEPSPQRSLSSSPVYRRQPSSPEETRLGQVRRRSSFSTASETFLRSSTSMLKGVAAGMMGGGVGVLR
ncbi:hypothetical protein JB92DRAFT_2835642 [Gautieria morchelliformis]|nr:hypothetical protein JB92DRAFT_2835642 [Gautieria morchelliformis]